MITCCDPVGDGMASRGEPAWSAVTDARVRVILASRMISNIESLMTTP